jgi:hypothetical protein
VLSAQSFARYYARRFVNSLEHQLRQNKGWTHIHSSGVISRYAKRSAFGCRNILCEQIPARIPWQVPIAGFGWITGNPEVIPELPAKSPFYEQATRVKGFLFLSFHSLAFLPWLLFVRVDPCRCLSTVFLFAL